MNATQRISAPRRLWLRWRFHLSALLVLIPLGFMPAYFHEARLDRGLGGLGEREVGELQVGPWSVRLAEWETGAPELEGRAGYMKAFTLAFCGECDPQVRAAYLRIGQPRDLRTAGALLSGSPSRRFVEVPVPARARPDDALWLTVEGWDGSVRQTSIPLAQASPSLVAWLQQRGKNQ
ncbi:hypothetical protein D3C76_505990 [compost metagenome]|uniref:Thiamine pyrophosphate-binding protein n=1 Tax=Pseudomonas jinjuensis TaxID=198616 RepID=A0A1H0LYL7_9PSED|nr:thiamine pyrophosphate-binding protein [Pseudomonas jinjuensis]SDO73066.1 hypothetical protein SAMN05216193_11511 [Pseudomonas jinjuensis]